MKAGAVGLSVALCASPSLAQDWEFSASIYGWLPGLDVTIDTPAGEISASPEGGNIFDVLQAAFMGNFEARNGQWGLFLDYLYADLANEEDTPLGGAFSKAEIDTRVSAFSGYALYRAVDTPGATVDLGAGFRLFNVEVDTNLESASSAPSRSFNNEEIWVVPLLAGRVRVPLGEKWFASGFADWGASGEDTSTWQAFAGAGYRFNENWSAQIGYRYMSLSKDIQDQETDLELSGPLLGVSYRF